MQLIFGNITFKRNIFNISKKVGDEDEFHVVDLIEEVVVKHIEGNFSSDSLGACLTSSSESDGMYTNFEREVRELRVILNVSATDEDMRDVSWISRFEELPPRDSHTFPPMINFPPSN